ncbi:MAG: protein-ADP-ribose hydrolase [Youngiibacter sp.]|nr:protein-ADP-ribose hydrolase [Youngiibacter sp.]
MDQSERLLHLIKALLDEDDAYRSLVIPGSRTDQERLLRSLMNVRMPKDSTEEFLKVQDEYLRNASIERGIVEVSEISTLAEEYPGSSLPFKHKLSIWQGDITRLQADAIVNAANSQMLGCFAPCHGCIDNAIHSAAGIQLRDECHRMMLKQGHDEDTGTAKITGAYNLPSSHVIHTVGPIVRFGLTQALEADLRSCYLSCLMCAADNGVRSIAFCCISTGEYNFPNERAAEIAFEAVIHFLKKNDEKFDRVIFNVFKDEDLDIYRNIASV